MEVTFYSCYRPFEIDNYSISFSTDNGATWAQSVDILALQPAAINATVNGTITASFSTVTQGVSNLTQCRIKFTFEGYYYFAFVDDVSINAFICFTNPPTSSLTTTICNNESVVINGNTYNASNPTGTEVLVGAGVYGCDSTININLNVLPALTGVNTTTICNDEDIVINGTTYNAANPTGTEVFTNIGPNGCDSTVTVNLKVLPAVDVTTVTSNETITANLTGATYQWIDCDNGNAPISGATNQSFTATSNGNYAVEITENGCIAVSACVEILSTGILWLEGEQVIVLYPNPTNDIVTIELSEATFGSVLEISNSIGQVLESKRISSVREIIDLGNYSNGIYSINLRTTNEVFSRKIIKY